MSREAVRRVPCLRSGERLRSACCRRRQQALQARSPQGAQESGGVKPAAWSRESQGRQARQRGWSGELLAFLGILDLILRATGGAMKSSVENDMIPSGLETVTLTAV